MVVKQKKTEKLLGFDEQEEERMDSGDGLGFDEAEDADDAGDAGDGA